MFTGITRRLISLPHFSKTEIDQNPSTNKYRHFSVTLAQTSMHDKQSLFSALEVSFKCQVNLSWASQIPTPFAEDVIVDEPDGCASPELQFSLNVSLTSFMSIFKWSYISEVAMSILSNLRNVPLNLGCSNVEVIKAGWPLTYANRRFMQPYFYVSHYFAFFSSLVCCFLFTFSFGRSFDRFAAEQETKP